MGYIIILAVLITSIIWMIKGRNSVPEGQIVSDSLTTKQKFFMVILCFLNPIIAGAIFYYGWKNKLPIKAKQANNISLLVFAIPIIIFIGLAILISILSK